MTWSPSDWSFTLCLHLMTRPSGRWLTTHVRLMLLPAWRSLWALSWSSWPWNSSEPDDHHDHVNEDNCDDQGVEIPAHRGLHPPLCPHGALQWQRPCPRLWRRWWWWWWWWWHKDPVWQRGAFHGMLSQSQSLHWVHKGKVSDQINQSEHPEKCLHRYRIAPEFCLEIQTGKIRGIYVAFTWSTQSEKSIGSHSEKYLHEGLIWYSA